MDLSSVEEGSLVDLNSAPALFDRYPMYALGIEWLEQFVMQPAEELGRPGHVCPRLAPAARQNLVRLGAVRTDEHSVEEACLKVLPLASLYHDLFPDQSDFRAGTLLAFFPDVPPSRAEEFIDEGHRRLRIEFVKRGLMLGEFHPRSQVASVRNPNFPVMRSPVPMFAVRALTTHDLMFLDTDETPPIQRVDYLRLYLQHLEGQLSATTRDRVRQRLAAAQAAAEDASTG